MYLINFQLYIVHCAYAMRIALGHSNLTRGINASSPLVPSSHGPWATQQDKRKRGRDKDREKIAGEEEKGKDAHVCPTSVCRHPCSPCASNLTLASDPSIGLYYQLRPLALMRPLYSPSHHSLKNESNHE